jgi:hypothetical protein
MRSSFEEESSIAELLFVRAATLRARARNAMGNHKHDSGVLRWLPAVR